MLHPIPIYKVIVVSSSPVTVL